MINRIACATLLLELLTVHAERESAAQIPESLLTPDEVKTPLGTLEFKDGVPSDATAARLYHHLDVTYAYRAFMDNMRGVSIAAIRKGLQDIGVKDNEVLALANATSRTLFMNPRHADWYYYPDSAWYNYLFVTGYEFETPIPEITKQGVKLFPPTGYRTMDARTSFFYGVTGITPAMAMRLTGIGSQYLIALVDADKNHFDGSKTYKVTLPKRIPAENFWSLTLYDNMTRSMLATPQRYPRAGSQNYPSPAAEADAGGSTTVYFASEQPDGVKRGNWIQTDPKKGWFIILRLYSPLPSFFDKSWRPSEIELAK